MKENNTYGERCTYCGRFRNLDDEICECGKGIGYIYDNDDNGFYWGELNNVDNILESKRTDNNYKMTGGDIYRIE